MYMVDIKNLLKYEGFREMNYCGPKIEKQQMKIYQILLKYHKTLASFGCISFVAVFGFPLFRNEKKLPNQIYEFTNLTQSPIFELLYLWQFLGSCILNILIFGYDCLLLGLLMFAYNQTMILKYDTRKILCRKIITNMDEHKMFAELRENIILHYRIIR